MTQDLTQKAAKGQWGAMLVLYNQIKNPVLGMCQFLLPDNREAESAATAVFKNLWEELVAGRVHSEEEFSQLAVRKTVMQCKAKTARGNTRAFHVPQNSNFTGFPCDVEKMDLTGEIYEVVLKNLPAYQRFIYVLHSIGTYSPQEIAKLFNTTEKVIEKALEAETANIDRITAQAAKRIGGETSLTRDAFHADLQTAVETLTVPDSLDRTVNSQIQTICEPLQKREKTKRNIILASVAMLVVIIGVILAATLAGSKDSDVDLDNADSDISMTDDADADEEVLDGGTEDEARAQVNATHYADIEIEGYGTITVALDGDTAPETVANFVSLAEEGFYDGLTFHRIDEGFMMQGGDPNGDGTGGSDTTITGEFSSNGFENNISHTRGTISMARANDYNSASSQFFIVHEDSDFLDGQYAAFGRVTEGMDIVDAICTSAEPIDSNSLIAAEEQPITTSITVRVP